MQKHLVSGLFVKGGVYAVLRYFITQGFTLGILPIYRVELVYDASSLALSVHCLVLSPTPRPFKCLDFRNSFFPYTFICIVPMYLI